MGRQTSKAVAPGLLSKRTVPPPSMLALDAPSREFCRVRRESTNTPLQALVLLNDPQFVEAARMLAQRLLHDAPDATDAERLARLFEDATGRPPHEDELSVLVRAHDEQRQPEQSQEQSQQDQSELNEQAQQQLEQLREQAQQAGDTEQAQAIQDAIDQLQQAQQQQQQASESLEQGEQQEASEPQQSAADRLRDAAPLRKAMATRKRVQKRPALPSPKTRAHSRN